MSEYNDLKVLLSTQGVNARDKYSFVFRYYMKTIKEFPILEEKDVRQKFDLTKLNFFILVFFRHSYVYWTEMARSKGESERLFQQKAELGFVWWKKTF